MGAPVFFLIYYSHSEQAEVKMTMQFLFYYIRFHKRTPQVLIVSRNIQPRVEIRENPTKGMRSIGRK